jgi:hypothetical protein
MIGRAQRSGPGRHRNRMRAAPALDSGTPGHAPRQRRGILLEGQAENAAAEMAAPRSDRKAAIEAREFFESGSAAPRRRQDSSEAPVVPIGSGRGGAYRKRASIGTAARQMGVLQRPVRLARRPG